MLGLLEFLELCTFHHVLLWCDCGGCGGSAALEDVAACPQRGSFIFSMHCSSTFPKSCWLISVSIHRQSPVSGNKWQVSAKGW